MEVFIRRAAFVAAILINMFVDSVLQAATLPQFRLQIYGLTDAEHTDALGRKYSFPRYERSLFGEAILDKRLFGESISPEDSDPVQSSWVSNRTLTERIGLFDAAHISESGGQTTLTQAVNRRGQAVGWSTRFETAGVEGDSAWFYNGNTTQRIGLFGTLAPGQLPNFSDGARYLNDKGYVAGESTTRETYWWDGPFRWAWFFNGVDSQRIGLDDEEHTDADGNTFNTVAGMNNQGQVIGTARSFHSGDGNRDVPINHSAWLFDGEHTIQLGYNDELHTSSSGIRSSRPIAILDSGMVVGQSSQYFQDGECEICGRFAQGDSAWTYQDGVTRRVGLADFQNENGTSYTSIKQVSPHGLLAGTSSYRSNDGFGVIKLWIDDGMQTIPIALPEPEVPDMPIVYRQIMPFGFTDDESLVVNGEFVADEGRLQFGNSWVYKDGNLRRVGLYDEAHRRANGSMKTEVTEILHGKFIIGHSDRYDQYSEQGLTMWVDDGSGAVPLELVTAEDDYNDLLFSTLAASNEKGQLAGGTIFRTESGTSVARPWFYDPVTGVIPIEVPDGMRITMKGLTETGWLYGSLAPVAGLPYGQGSAFLWSPSTGFVRLSAMLSNDFSIADFRPDEIVQGIGSSLFAGYGTNANGTFAFMAIAVPEPSGIMLLAIALTTLSRKRRLAA